MTDLHQAVKYYQLAADQGHGNAQCKLGICYENGHGVTKGLHQAVKYYQLAADQGYADAQSNMGDCYSMVKEWQNTFIKLSNILGLWVSDQDLK